MVKILIASIEFVRHEGIIPHCYIEKHKIGFFNENEDGRIIDEYGEVITDDTIDEAINRQIENYKDNLKYHGKDFVSIEFERFIKGECGSEIYN